MEEVSWGCKIKALLPAPLLCFCTFASAMCCLAFTMNSFSSAFWNSVSRLNYISWLKLFNCRSSPLKRFLWVPEKVDYAYGNPWSSRWGLGVIRISFLTDFGVDRDYSGSLISEALLYFQALRSGDSSAMDKRSVIFMWTVLLAFSIERLESVFLFLLFSEKSPAGVLLEMSGS